MASKRSEYDEDPAPTPARRRTTTNGDTQEQAWAPPTSDQEFVFDTIQNAPDWVDRNWAGFDRGPALAVPAGDLYNEHPYTTQSARPGDTVKFIAAKGSLGPHIEVIRGELDPAKGTKRIAQQSAAQEEDLLKLGWITVDDLGEDAKAQILARSPKLKGLIEGTTAAPVKQNAADLFVS
jgi:hypothetical protein